MSYEELVSKLKETKKEDIIFELYMKSVALETSQKERRRLEVENKALKIGLQALSEKGVNYEK